MIYTKTGDKGTTSLANGERVSKADVRVEAYGTVDELNSWVGMLRVIAPDVVLPQLIWIQNKLFNLGAALSESPGEWIASADVQQIEQWIDIMQAQVPKQKEFLLPTGDEAMCRCHVCRTICRRAERRMVALEANDVLLQFANRLSDYWFVLSRYMGMMNKVSETGWRSNISV